MSLSGKEKSRLPRQEDYPKTSTHSPIRAVDLKEDGALALGVVPPGGRVLHVLILMVGVVLVHVGVQHHARIRDTDLTARLRPASRMFDPFGTRKKHRGDTEER